MRVRRKEMANRIKSNLAYLSNICSDKEEIIDAIFHYFARLHGIGVAVKEEENANVYTFMQYPNHTESVWHPLDTGYEQSTCISTTMTVVKRQIEQTGADNIKYILKFVEKRLSLPHWEDYLEERPKGDGLGFRATNYVFDEMLMKHDDNLDAMRYGYGGPVIPKMQICYQASRGCGKSSWITQAMKEYAKQDVKVTCDAYKHILNWQYGLPRYSMPEIDKVVFNEPATIVMWKDGTKTVVKAQDGEVYDPEKGLAMAICKKAMCNTRDYYIPFKKYLKQWKKEHPEKETARVFDATGKQLVAFDFNPDEEVEVHAAFRQFADAHELRMWRYNDLLPCDYSYKFAQGDGENEKTYTILVNSICITRRALNDHLLALAQYFHL